jgi:hypothetical protein
MKRNRLLLVEKPWLHLLIATDEEAWDLLSTLPDIARERVVGRLIRGQKARTTADFFTECSAALQFPPYFGENWDAFEETINDLEWLRGDAYTILITSSNHLLDKAPAGQLQTLLKVLDQAGEEWSKPVRGEWSRPARPFHVVLQSTKEAETALRQKLDAAQVAYKEIPCLT